MRFTSIVVNYIQIYVTLNFLITDSEIVRQLVLGSIRSRSRSNGRRSFSAQNRPIAPASHSRDIGSIYSKCWNQDHAIEAEVEAKVNENIYSDQTRRLRSISQHQRRKTLQIVELGSSPNKYTAVRHVDDPKTEFTREGKRYQAMLL